MGYRRSWKQIVLSSSLLLVATPKPAFAVDLVLNHRISAALANEAVAAVVSTCAVRGYTESATLVDIDGVPEATLRGDGAGVHTQESASDKAYTSVSLKIDTLTLKGQVQNTVAPGGPFSKLPHLLLFGGGVVIKLGSETIGAIGAAGAPGDKIDDACAHAGLDKIKDRLVP
ncbi:GlcG/HbpS family heme-binding protein [Paraburkholderia flava]|uniref:GlcG/HbpS family heme-binding protein n=1 Tax=Paraburkholderia flava TaxID=2547393 RepID=UPI00105FAC72|nr:heme-binding protein [Paraburkholderia flava]